MKKLSFVIFIVHFKFLSSFVFSQSDNKETREQIDTNVCDTGPKGGVKWILHVMQPDFGWKEHTHRANIALAVNNWKGVDESAKNQMELQLEVELTKALTRNSISTIHENDLALYIHALIATEKNPRDFHGIDLVFDLLSRIDQAPKPLHPFLILTLCNSQAVEYKHLGYIIHYAENDSKQDLEKMALALKALACAADLYQANHEKQRFDNAINSAKNNLMSNQLEDGSFGNPYTTALVVQALIASDADWEKEAAALEYLEAQSVDQVNMLKAYYIEMALNAKKVKFIKDLHAVKTERLVSKVPVGVKQHSIQYSIIADPSLFYTINIEVPDRLNFFEIMKLCASRNEQFNFTSYLNGENDPVVYSVSGIPNDAEENMFWRLCVTYAHQGRQQMYTFKQSPVKLLTSEHARIFKFWFRNSDCPTQ